jgi:hypothetical protein
MLRKLLVACLILCSSRAIAQVPSRTVTSAPVPPPPATKLEAFQPAAGSILTFGYHDLGSAGCCVTVDARRMADSKGNAVNGMVVEVHESEYRVERSFVDVDEIPELIKAMDALLEVKTNPTKFENFEVRYSTRGELQITAFNSKRGKISYSVKAGRVVAAQQFIDEGDMQKLRGFFAAALDEVRAGGTSSQ